MKIQLLKEEYEKKMVTNHAELDKGALFEIPEDEEQRKTWLRFLKSLMS